MDLVVAATVFALIFPAELPDKTLVATLVLSTRFRPLPVWCGVAAAFAVQSLVAVTAGGLLSRLPRPPVLAVTSVLFAIGALLLLRSGNSAEVTDGGGDVPAAVAPPSARRIAATSFGVLFAAEWGDLSQLLTAGLAARYRDPVSVFVGSWAALAVIAAIAVVAGRGLLKVVPVRLVRRLAAGLFGLLAVVTALEAAGLLG